MHTLSAYDVASYFFNGLSKRTLKIFDKLNSSIFGSLWFLCSKKTLFNPASLEISLMFSPRSFVVLGFRFIIYFKLAFGGAHTYPIVSASFFLKTILSPLSGHFYWKLINHFVFRFISECSLCFHSSICLSCHVSCVLITIAL